MLRQEEKTRNTRLYVDLPYTRIQSTRERIFFHNRNKFDSWYLVKHIVNCFLFKIKDEKKIEELNMHITY